MLVTKIKVSYLYGTFVSYRDKRRKCNKRNYIVTLHLWNVAHKIRFKGKSMNITLITVGKIKEKYYRDAIAEYAKRLGRYCKLDIIEVADEKTPDKASEVVEEQIKQKEAERILKNIKDDAYCIALAIEGKKLDSVSMAKHIEQLGLTGKSNLAFVIGGSLGLHKSVLQRADEKLSFSDMTFPHQLMRVILLEQIYRCYRIINGEPYHK